jgi:hypothetical protein
VALHQTLLRSPLLITFLANRTQTVLLENTTSEKIAVTSGVPQGTVLWPILFLIYINDLPDYSKHSQIRLFVDDSIIYRPIKTQADCIKLQEDLESAVKWEPDWRLGRTRDWYALSFTDFELIWRLRLMNERDLFALDVIC